MRPMLGTSFYDPLLSSRFHLVAFDIRGHGASDKPDAPEYYAEDRLFADDVRAVIDSLGLEHPVLVGWSYAGRIVGDYLESYGTRRLAGINYVCARTNNQSEFVGPGNDHLAGMTGGDHAADLAATREFVRTCFAREVSGDMLEEIVACNMLVPAHIRAAHLSRPPSDGAILSRIDVPVLVSQGDRDLLVLKGLAALTASLVPGAMLSLYGGVGHSPFAEDPDRFNRELTQFATAAHARRG